MRGSALLLTGFLFVALAAFSAPVHAQAAEVPAFAAGAQKLYCHAAADSLTAWVNTLEEDGGNVPYYFFGAPTTTLPGVNAGMDPAANAAFTSRFPLNPALAQELVLEGTITVQAYIGGGTYTAGVASIGTSLAVNGANVATAAAKNHVMTPGQSGATYNAISWTMAVPNTVVPAGSTLEWVISGTVYAANNVYLACHAARGRSYIELPVVSASSPAGGDLNDTDLDGLNDTWETEQFGNLTAQNGTGDPDGDGLNNTAEFEQGTNATSADTDGDGLDDGNEVELGTNATNPDTDGDGATDGEEVDAGTDPLDPDDFPIADVGNETEGPDLGNGTLEEDSDGAAGGGDGGGDGERSGLDGYLDSIKADTGYAGTSAAGMAGVMVLSLIGLAGRWGL